MLRAKMSRHGADCAKKLRDGSFKLYQGGLFQAWYSKDGVRLDKTEE